MSTKRSRAAYEADNQSQQLQYVLFGTPLPPQDPEIRDDGSFVPVWKQEVRDERGRKRLHGAFTGGWSAGYFNTVGSKEGWTPSDFVSSRTNRRKDGAAKSVQQRPEDFMDDEDLADAAEAEKLQTSDSFAGLGADQNNTRRGLTGLLGLLHAEGETMGVRLLQKMGWKKGQGIGPKVRRKARLDLKSAPGEKSQAYLFAPKNVTMVHFNRKVDHKGLGFDGEGKLNPTPVGVTRAEKESGSEEDDSLFSLPSFPKARTKKGKPVRGGIGMGVLNDTGSDDEDPYEIGPKISYNKVIGGDKKRKKSLGIGSSSSNPSTNAAPTFAVRKNIASRTLRGLRKCHDGRLPLTGFMFGIEPDILITAITSDGKYPPPTIPTGWKSAKTTHETGDTASPQYKSAADVAKESKLNPAARAEILGESQLPGKSVFDFLSSSARDRLAAASGKTNLPQGRGEIPAEYAMSEEEKARHVFSGAPKLEKETAVAAMTRGVGPGAPYSEDEAKRNRYRKFLEYHAGYAANIPPRPHGANDGDWLSELQEFYSCARIFKPMAGAMASRFTTSSSNTKTTLSYLSKSTTDQGLVSRPATKPADPAEEAAMMGIYGPMTRTVEEFFPTRLLCKRFNVKPPAHVQADADQKLPQGQSGPSKFYNGGESSGLVSYAGDPMDVPPAEAFKSEGGTATPAQDKLPQGLPVAFKAEPVVVDAGRNEAIEGKRAHEEVFAAIFGDSDDDVEEG